MCQLHIPNLLEGLSLCVCAVYVQTLASHLINLMDQRSRECDEEIWRERTAMSDVDVSLARYMRCADRHVQRLQYFDSSTCAVVQHVSFVPSCLKIHFLVYSDQCITCLSIVLIARSWHSLCQQVILTWALPVRCPCFVRSLNIVWRSYQLMTPAWDSNSVLFCLSWRWNIGGRTMGEQSLVRTHGWGFVEGKHGGALQWLDWTGLG